MSCDRMRDLEYEKERERDNERKRKKAKEAMEKAEKERKELEKKRREKAEETIRELAEKSKWLLKEFPFHPGSFHMYKPGTDDIIPIKVLEDGVVRVDMRGRSVSQANHPSFDAFMNNLRDTLKGTWRDVAKGLGFPGAHAHTHDHVHTHLH